MRITIIMTLLCCAGLVQAQQNLLQSGPMLGYVDFREVLLWAQTKSAAEVAFEYWPADQPTLKKKTESVKTEKSTGFTAKCTVEDLEPGVRYQYQLLINGQALQLPYATTFKTQTLWQWRTDPPAFTVAAGSCNYVNEENYDRPGKPYGSEHGIFNSIHQKQPDLMLWLGDNTYLREVDWSTRSGMIHRYTHSRSLPEVQPLLASTAHYATWDDHDYGPNDSDGSWVHKERALEVFKMFWGNPSFGVSGEPSVATAFTYNDVDFFMLDNRYYRTSNYCKTCPERTELGKTQLEWFKQALATSNAPFKIVCIGGQVLTSSESSETYAHYFKAERDSMLAYIERENIKNVVFLTGDRHFAELSKLTNAKGNDVYDLTTSSLTAGSYTNAAKEMNQYRVEGTLSNIHNFAVLEFSGPRKERVLTLRLFDTNGKELWTHRINSQAK